MILGYGPQEKIENHSWCPAQADVVVFVQQPRHMKEIHAVILYSSELKWKQVILDHKELRKKKSTPSGKNIRNDCLFWSGIPHLCLICHQVTHSRKNQASSEPRGFNTKCPPREYCQLDHRILLELLLGSLSKLHPFS